MTNTPSPLSLSGIVDLASAYYGSAILFAMLQHDLFTQIAVSDDPTSESLAQSSHLSQRGISLLLDGAVAVGLLTKEGGRYLLTPASEISLVAGAPHDLTRAIAYNRDVYGAWGQLAQFVQTGAPVEPPSLHLGDDAVRTRRFAYSMHGRAMGIGKSVIPALDLPPHSKILDLAGGPGTYAMLMAQTDPTITCDTYDLPAISAVAQEITSPVANQVTCHAGDYHVDTYPEATYDVVSIFGALHQESPTMIVDILTRARRALKPGGRIYILDLMTHADHTTPPFSALFAVNMALTTDNGWVFSDQEISQWLQEAGFAAPSITPLPPPMPHWIACASTQP